MKLTRSDLYLLFFTFSVLAVVCLFVNSLAEGM
jgi:hypothetical protein